MAAEDERIIAGTNAASVLAAVSDGDEDALGDEPDLAAAVACLEDVLAAQIVREDGRTVAVGVAVVDGDESEVLCLVGDEGDEDDLAEQVEESLDPDRALPSSRQPLGELLEAPEGTTRSEGDRSFARGVAVLRGDRPVGLLLPMLVRREL